MNEDIIKELKSTIPWIIVAALAVAGYYGIKNYRAAQKVAASEAVANAYTTTEAEEAVAKYGSSDAGTALKVKLAKKYYDDARYEDAIKLYDELAGEPTGGFEGISAVGKAECLEALAKYADAKSAYTAFAEKNPTHYLALTAKLGAIRTTALAGDKTAAEKDLAALKETLKGDANAKVRIEVLEDTIKRFVPAKK